MVLRMSYGQGDDTFELREWLAACVNIASFFFSLLLFSSSSGLVFVRLISFILLLYSKHIPCVISIIDTSDVSN